MNSGQKGRHLTSTGIQTWDVWVKHPLPTYQHQRHACSQMNWLSNPKKGCFTSSVCITLSPLPCKVTVHVVLDWYGEMPSDWNWTVQPNFIPTIQYINIHSVRTYMKFLCWIIIMSFSEQQRVDIAFLTCDISTTGSGHDSSDEIVGCKTQSSGPPGKRPIHEHWRTVRYPSATSKTCAICTTCRYEY